MGGGVIAYVGGGAPLTLDDSDVTGNIAFSAAGIYSCGSTVSITNGSTVSGNDASEDCGGISASGAIVISDSTLANNQASDEGGAICARASLVINTSSITGNDALFGGGIDASGSTSIYRSTLSGNTAAADGGGIRASGTVSIVESTLSGNTGFFGGAIKSYGTLTINRSTISGSNAAFGGGVPIPFNPAEATIVNSTLWNNTGSLGGGILTYGTQRVLGSTIAYNTGGLSASGGGIHAVNTGSAEIRNSILALNAAVYPNAPGTVTSGGHTPSARRPAVPVGWVATSPAWRARGSRPVRRATAADGRVASRQPRPERRADRRLRERVGWPALVRPAALPPSLRLSVRRRRLSGRRLRVA